MTAEADADRVDQLIADFVAAERAGTAPQQQAWLAQHPEHAAELTAFFEDRQRFDAAVAPLRNLVGDTNPVDATVAFSQAGEPTSLATAGQRCGEYELLQEVARGGMGVVFKARHVRLNRIVALKMVISGRGASPAELERFHAEAQAVARLDHPHIVPVYEVGEQAGRPFFSMQFIAGGSLRMHVERLRRDPRGVARLIVTAARAVHHAHQRGILHRDLKPGNILIDEQGQPHVTDFGLAKRLEDDSQLTQEGAVLGTPSYMAPEQARGQADLTTAADVYGLGAVLYELLTGRPPFQGKNPVETIVQVTTHEVTPPRSLDPAINADLATICVKCLEKEPAKRYGSAAELADDLERWLNGQPIVARPVSAGERLVKWARRQPLLAGAFGTVAATVLALLVVAGVLWQNAEARAQAVLSLDQAQKQLARLGDERKQAEDEKKQAKEEGEKARQLADEQRQIAEQQQQLAEKQKKLADKTKTEVERLQKSADEEAKKAVAARDQAEQAVQKLAAARVEANRTLYAADMQLAHVAWQAGNVGSTNELLLKYVPAKDAAGEDPRGFEWHYLWRQSHVARRSWRPETPTSMNFSPVFFAISPDGKTLATASQAAQPRSLRLWNLADGKLARTIMIGDANVTHVAFADEGRRVLVTHRKPPNFALLEKALADAVKKKEPFTLKLLQDNFEFRSWSTTDNSPGRNEPFDPVRLDGMVFPVLAGLPFATHEGTAIGIFSLVRSPDRRFLAIGGMSSVPPNGDVTVSPDKFLRGGVVLVYDLEKSQVVARREAAEMVTTLRFAPESKLLAAGYSNGGIDLFEPDLSRQVRRINGHTGFVYTLEFSADGERLLSGARDGGLRRWDVATGDLTAQFRGHPGAVMQVALSPDGQTIVSGGLDGEIKVWDSVGTSDTRKLRGHEKQIIRLGFSPDGRELRSLDMDGRMKTWQTADEKLVRDEPLTNVSLFSAELTQRSAAWSQALKTKGLFVVRNLATGQNRQLTWKDRNPSQVALSSDDRLVATSDLEKGEIAIWTVADGKPWKVLTHVDTMPQHLTFSPDGQSLAAIHTDKNGLGAKLLVWNCETGEPRTVMEMKSFVSAAAAFSPDQSLIAVGEAGNAVRIWNLREDRLHTEFRAAGVTVTQLAFTPDGRRLATVWMTPSEQALLKLWDVTTGREVFSAVLPPVLITALAISPDGHHLAAATAPKDVFAFTSKVSAEILVWDATPATE